MILLNFALFLQQAVRALVYMKNQLQFQLQQQQQQRNPYGVYPTSGANSINGIYTPQQNPYPQLTSQHSYGGSSNGGYRYGPTDAFLKKIYFLHKEWCVSLKLIEWVLFGAK